MSMSAEALAPHVRGSRSLSPYRAVARIAARSLIVYRTPFLLSLIGSVLTFASMLYLWRTLIEDEALDVAMTWEQMKTYLLVGFVVGTLVSPWTDWRMAARILDGSVASDMTRPLDFQRARLAETAGFASVEGFVALIVGPGVIACFGGIEAPTWGRTLGFAVSVLLVVPLKFCIVYLFSLLCFWTQGFQGVNWARIALTMLFSGALAPLALFPDWFQVLAAALPFQATVYTPAVILTGNATGVEAARLLLIQAFWAVALWWMARWAWNGASRTLTVHGG